MAPARSIVKHQLQADQKLVLGKLQTLQTRDDVANLLEIPVNFLTDILHHARERDHYHTFEVPKKSGGTRQIDAPTNNLKILQRKLNYALRLMYHEHSAAHGFTADRSIVSNAKVHAGQLWILNIDLQDFFHSIHIGRIVGALCSPTFKFGREASTVIAQISTRGDGVLPQGSPLSPLISNIIAYELDKQLSKKCSRLKARYTRYADDISISTRRPTFPTELARLEDSKVVLSDFLYQTVKSCGFTVNNGKSRLNRRSQRLEVTGLVVNEFPNVDRHFIRQTRTLIHLWRKHGKVAASAVVAEWIGRPVAIENYIRGRISYLAMVRGKCDPTTRQLAKQLNDLEPQTCTWLCSIATLQPQAVSSRRVINLRREMVGQLIARSTVQLAVSKNGEEHVGSAFFVTPNLLATAGHNCDNSTIEYWHHSGAKVPLNILKYQNKDGIDVGLLEVKSKKYESKTFLNLRMRLPEFGEDVLAGGYPPVQRRDSALSVLGGIVESLPTSYSKLVRYIQVGMHIPGGLSGGPLVDRRGNAVGIMIENTYKMQQSSSDPNDEAESEDKRGKQSSLVPSDESPIRVFGHAMPIEYFIDIWRNRLAVV